MSTEYIKTSWQDGDIITADKMNNIENGIKDVDDTIGELKENFTNLIQTTVEDNADLYITDRQGNVIAEFINGHIVTKNFNSADALTAADLTEIEATLSSLSETVESAPTTQDFQDLADDVSAIEDSISDMSTTMSTAEHSADLFFSDENGNVIAMFRNGHIVTKNFDSSLTGQDGVKTVNHTLPDANGNVDVIAELDPTELQTAVDDFLTEHPVVASAAGIVSVADYGAVGDGVTDDSTAVQNAVNSNYDVYFESNKTYYLASTVTINHDIKLHGGENSVIKTKTPTGGVVNNAMEFSGALKKTTTLTTDYTTDGYTDNSGNRFTLADMTGIEVGDIMVVSATDQFYSYARRYYYLGATMLISDIKDGHIYTSDVMPWDIQKTSALSVKIYHAPTIVIDNLNFLSDTDGGGNYKRCVSLAFCKNSVLKNFDVSHMDNGVFLQNCVNTLIDSVTVSQTGADLTDGGGTTADHYGISINSCSNTLVQRVVAMCANSCVDLSGQTPNINTRIIRCNLFSECRPDGLGMHENAYNTVVEDCVLGGMIAYGTVLVNRCRFVNNNRTNDGDTGIIFRGTHKPEWAKLRVTNCVFDYKMPLTIDRPRPQSPIQSYESIIGSLEVYDCVGGQIGYAPTESTDITKIVIKKFELRNWKDIFEFFHATGSYIENLIVDNCTFTHPYWINSHTDNFCFDGIEYCHIIGDAPLQDRMIVNLLKNGCTSILPSGVHISLSSTDSSAHYMVCGKNIGSNAVEDYAIGSISGSVGNALSKTIDASFENALSVNSGSLVFKNVNSNTGRSVWLKCMAYVPEVSKCTISCKLKNVGATSPSAFRLSVCVIDADTRKVTRSGQATAVAATSEGASAEYSYRAGANSFVQFYIYCSTTVANAETMFEDLMMSIVPFDMDAPAYVAYNGSSIDGDGTLDSVEGLNHIMGSVYDFNASFKADCMEV